MKYWLLFLCLFAAVPSWSENTYYRFRVYLKDKGNQTCNTDHPEAFLSEAAILRREQQQIPVSYSDLPISNSYKEQLANCGCALITESRWLSTVVVEYPDSSLVEKLKRLAFVDSVCWVWKGKHIPLQEPDHTETLHIDKKTLRNRYGYAQKQIRMMKGDKLHKRGFRGEGMRIAVIDAGFTDVNRIDAFASTHIEGTRNIVYPGKTVYASDAHGTKVLSCLAANLPGIMTGTAPEATYWLIKSEDSNGESPIEQDYWAAAVEYADSVGAYIISSSLGYFDFDEPATDYTHEDLTGRKAFISQAAQMAAEKGLLVFTSAGNEGNTRWEKITVPADTPDILTVGAGYVCLLMGGLWMSRLLKHNLMDDVFNNENESFMQETRLIESEYSVNLPTRFYYKKRWNNGWINVVNPFRASIVLGTPGSGKSYAVVNNFIKQQIEKGFSMYVYDFKFSDLSTIAYNHLLNHPEGYKVKPKFYVINFDDPRRSHRCNPIHPDFMEDITDAYESAYTIMLNLNKSWVQKQGDFFVESPIILFAAIIWYLKIFQNGKYCTFPHAIEFLNRRYEDIFPILTSYPELENYLSPFMDAWLGGAAEQLMGQIASAKIPLSRMISPQLYWVMSDSEFTLDINNPEEPKILCVGNNPDRQNIYGAALGLYNSRIVKLINKKGMLKSSVIIDELPTIYFKGLDNLIATARSNKVAVCLGFQDFSQLVRDYGDKEAKVVMNTVGNIFSGQVVGETAKTLSERFGKVLQKRQSISINRQDVSTSINTQMDSLIPPSKISGLTQGMFVGSVSDNFNERIEQKIFHCEIVVDAEKVKREEKAYKKIPVITDFTDGDGNDRMKETVQANYRRIKEEVKQIVQEELERIANDENLKHLLQQK